MMQNEGQTARLNDVQRKLAEEHYDLIDKCLRKVDHQYRMEYYDAAAVKLCEIARDYTALPDEEFRRYAAKSILNKIAQEQAKSQAAKRNAPLLSLADKAVCDEAGQIMIRDDISDFVSDYHVRSFCQSLNEREQRIVTGVIQGFTYDEIGCKEQISRSRVKQIIKKIRIKYEAQNI